MFSSIFFFPCPSWEHIQQTHKWWRGKVRSEACGYCSPPRPPAAPFHKYPKSWHKLVPKSDCVLLATVKHFLFHFPGQSNTSVSIVKEDQDLTVMRENPTLAFTHLIVKYQRWSRVAYVRSSAADKPHRLATASEDQGISTSWGSDLELVFMLQRKVTSRLGLGLIPGGAKPRR